MLEVKKTAIAFEATELLDLERIITDLDEKGALQFIKKSIYDKILHAQQGRLKSHLDSTNPVEGFTKNR